MLDSLPPEDFFGIFDRVTDYIDLTGCVTAEQIIEKVKASKAWKRPAQRYSKRQKGWVKARGSMKRLIEKGFAERVARHFRTTRELDDMIRLTLLWGKEKALQIKKVLARKRLGAPAKRAKLSATKSRKGLREERRIAEVGAKELSLRERLFARSRRKRSVWTD